MMIGVLASGRGSNLEALIAEVHAGPTRAKIAVVISDKKDARALEKARENGIEAIHVDPDHFPSREAFDRRLMDILQERAVGLVCLAGFLRILSPMFVRAFHGKIMNIHPALLPAFPGLNAQRQALEHGVKVAGCTVHFVDEGIDTGPIILQTPVPVLDEDTVESLSQRILLEEHKLYPQAVRLFVEGKLTITGNRVNRQSS